MFSTLFNYWLGMRATYDILDLKQNVARGGRPKATFCLEGQYLIYCPNWRANILYIVRIGGPISCMLSEFPVNYCFLLYLHNPTINILTIHGQTEENLDKLIWYELDFIWIDIYSITPADASRVNVNIYEKKIAQISLEQRSLKSTYSHIILYSSLFAGHTRMFTYHH